MSSASYANLSLEQCEKLMSKSIMKNGEKYYINPITKREIKASAPIFKSMEKHCKQIMKDTRDTKHKDDKDTLNTSPVAASAAPKTRVKDEYVERWLQNPLQDPKKGVPILADIDSESTYAKWYEYAYKHGHINRLPKEHLLFGSVDILLYRMDKTKFSHNDMLFYDFIERAIRIKESVNIRYIIRSYGYDNKYELFVLYELVKMFAHSISIYIKYVMKLIHTVKYKHMDKYVPEITTTIQDIEFIQLFNSNYGTHDELKKLFTALGDDLIPKNRKYDYHYITDFKLNILNTHDCFQKVRDYFEEILNIYNYATEPTKSPFENINNEGFKEIEDPIITILKKIGINNINLATLKLPTRPFNNDQEYDKYFSQYNELKAQYNEDISTWKKNGSVDAPPKRPTMILPSQKVLNVTVEMFPRYIKDEEYNKTLNIYNANKKTIDLYHELIDVGVLDLLNRAGIKNLSPSPKKNSASQNSKSPKSQSILHKNREYFEDHVFDINDKNKAKCNSNVDAISQDDFDNPDDKYPLAKLQLMFKLQKKDENGNIIRTDCFYAPNFYNYVVNKVNAREPILNPLTKEPITEDDINQLLKIMKIVIPDIKRPEYFPPIRDTKLTLKSTETEYRGKPFYNISINRMIGDIDFEIFNLCSIPADIEIQESGSSDITSSVFLTDLSKLFDSGKMLYTYMPPYHNENEEYIKTPNFQFYNYRTPHSWYKSREKQIEMFKQYHNQLKDTLR